MTQRVQIIESSRGPQGIPGEAGLTGPSGPQGLPGVPGRVFQSGRKWVVLAGSHGAQHYPNYPYSRTSYSRAAGVATVLTTEVVPPMKAGQPFRFANKENPDAEGDFVLSVDSVPEASGTRFTWADARANRGALSTAGQLLDKRGWNGPQAFMAWANAFLGLPVDDMFMAATSGADFTDWLTPERQEQITSNGPYGAALVYLFGNSILTGGLSSSQIIDQAVQLIEILAPITSTIYLVTPPSIRNLDPADTGWVRASNLIRMIASAPVRGYPNVRVVHASEHGVVGWSPAADATPDDVLNNWPAEFDLNPDGTHNAWNAALATGNALAAEMAREIQPRPALPLAMSDAVPRASGLDSGSSVVSLVAPWVGNVPSSALVGDGLSGTIPDECTLSIGNRGSATAVSSITTHPVRGSRWRVQVTCAINSSLGQNITATRAPAGLAALLQARAGQRARVVMPIALRGFIPQAIVSITAGLYCTIDGTEVLIAEALSDRGQHSNYNMVRTVDAPFALQLASPKVLLPVGTYTTAELRVLVRHVPGAVSATGPGTYVLELGPDLAVEAFPVNSYYEAAAA